MKVLALAILIFSLSLTGCDKGNKNQNQMTPPTYAPIHMGSAKLTTCPDFKTLHKEDGKFWKGPGGYESHEISFAKTATAFVGAQWKGIHRANGKIICIYQAGGGADFRIAIQTNKELAEPAGSNWRTLTVPDQLGDIVLNCHAANGDVNSCKFPGSTLVYNPHNEPLPANITE